MDKFLALLLAVEEAETRARIAHEAGECGHVEWSCSFCGEEETR